MNEKRISQAEFDKAVETVMTQEVKELEGELRLFIPMVNAVFAAKLSIALFNEKENMNNG